jgi:CMP-2-keto-3-deoxyoctulosonic acid synthetase
MRALDNGLPIHALITNGNHWAVDTKKDLIEVEKMMNYSQKQPIEKDE